MKKQTKKPVPPIAVRTLDLKTVQGASPPDPCRNPVLNFNHNLVRL
jgi:hypothetical protein